MAKLIASKNYEEIIVPRGSICFFNNFPNNLIRLPHTRRLDLTSNTALKQILHHISTTFLSLGLSMMQ